MTWAFRRTRSPSALHCEERSLSETRPEAEEVGDALEEFPMLLRVLPLEGLVQRRLHDFVEVEPGVENRLQVRANRPSEEGDDLRIVVAVREFVPLGLVVVRSSASVRTSGSLSAA